MDVPMDRSSRAKSQTVEKGNSGALEVEDDVEVLFVGVGVETVGCCKVSIHSHSR